MGWEECKGGTQILWYKCWSKAGVLSCSNVSKTCMSWVLSIAVDQSHCGASTNHSRCFTYDGLILVESLQSLVLALVGQRRMP